jgi:hypothetical protein
MLLPAQSKSLIPLTTTVLAKNLEVVVSYDWFKAAVKPESQVAVAEIP